MRRRRLTRIKLRALLDRDTHYGRFLVLDLSNFRFCITIALALALAIEGFMRSNINMAMVCMVNKTALAELTSAAAERETSSILLANGNGTLAQFLSNITRPTTSELDLEDPSCSNSTHWFSGEKTSRNYSGELVIPKSEQSLIFTSFYLGGLAIIMPGSYLCDYFGATNLVLYGAILNVIGTFVTPFTARNFASWALITVRFIMGCGQGILVPCMNVMITHWFPLSEKSTAIAIATTGNQVSVIVAMFLTAELCLLDWLGGWPWAFYVYGIFGIMFCIFWMSTASDSPANARRITHNELNFIRQCEHSHLNHQNGGGKLGRSEVPWAKILSSSVIWSTALCSFSQNFMNVGTVVYLPTYYNNVLRMDLTSNGVMSALPFVVQLVTKILFAGIADHLKTQSIMSHTSVVKMFNLIASVGSGVCFILLSFCDCSQPLLAIFLAITAMGLSSGFIPGYNTSVVCVAPRHTSAIASFSRLLGQIASVASPYMIGMIVVKGVKEEWQLAFWVIAGILISTGIFFQLFGSASIQEWAQSTPVGDQKRVIKDGNAEKDDTTAFISAPSTTT